MKSKEITLTEKQKKIVNEIAKQSVKLNERIQFKEEAKNFLLFFSLLSIAILGRISLQFVPSVEPIIPLAIIASLLFGLKEGFIFGSTAYIITNFFVWGNQGIWTVFQALGAGIAGSLGFFLKRKKELKAKHLIFFTIIGTIIFEIIMNVFGSIFGIGLIPSNIISGILFIPFYFITSLPFSLTHIFSNILFAKIFFPLTKLRRQSNEIKIYSIKHYNNNASNSIWLYNTKRN